MVQGRAGSSAPSVIRSLTSSFLCSVTDSLTTFGSVRSCRVFLSVGLGGARAPRRPRAQPLPCLPGTHSHARRRLQTQSRVGAEGSLAARRRRHSPRGPN